MLEVKVVRPFNGHIHGGGLNDGHGQPNLFCPHVDALSHGFERHVVQPVAQVIWVDERGHESVAFEVVGDVVKHLESGRCPCATDVCRLAVKSFACQRSVQAPRHAQTAGSGNGAAEMVVANQALSKLL